jgi:D-amino peptidase
MNRKEYRVKIGLSVLLSLVPVAALTAAQPRVLVIYDMEGVSGIDHESMTDFGSPDYPEGRELLTSDVNAAIRGLFAGGAGSVWIQDGHGSGNSDEPDLLLDRMDSRARFDFRDRDYDPYSTGLDGSLDAIVCIGMHARANSDGFLAHTYTLEPSFRVNGVDITETQIVALSAARWGVPVIMGSGDDVLGAELAPELPDLEYATVKTAVNRARAEPLPQDEVRRRIESAATRAMGKLLSGALRPYYFRPPFVFELSFQNGRQARAAMSDQAVERVDDLTVRYIAPTFNEGYDRSKHLIALASSDRLRLLVRLLQQSEDGKKLLDEYRALLSERWLEPEKLPAWAASEAMPPKKKRFHGDN